MAISETEFPLSPYRVLDLTDEKGLLCGKPPVTSVRL